MAQQTKASMVKNQIKEWIDEGKVLPGEKIYSENELVKMFEVSRHTVRQAVGDLVHEGWLYREQGAGTFVSNRREQIQIQPVSSTGKNIGVITTYISDYIFPSIIKGIESYLSSHGYSLTFACTDNDPEKEKQCLEAMLSRNIDGLIVEPTRSSSYNPNLHYYLEMEQNQIPYLMINQYYPQLNPPNIILDDEKGGFIATDHLIKLGHTKVIGIFKSDDNQGLNRMQGFIRAFRENNIQFFPEMIVTYTTEEKEGTYLQKLKDILVSDEKPTGIVCYNDEIAIKVLNVLRDLEIKVPEELSIVGYDDSYLAEASEIKLTSVTHPKMDMGIEAAKWIVSAVENGDWEETRQKVYEPEIVIRNSTSAISKNSNESKYVI
ncbi:GntR family transcriptional regulator [Bacillus sp. 7586-K]|uniref:GntR family transcriptional regulator of arabinose operon n=1 Tax=Metabacillus niabensis TaxID=324854 RepID=A0ABT9YVK0_9BACI|nr:GntR family transcriptional regulator [Metabacillus niabensis]MDQ0223759.1 GntR family transcriptional regulator of arabinose operon [Metabacillus niabensis]PAD66673.1 GntR family transcriptional regulator [Bacillus sp. 7586-K]